MSRSSIFYITPLASVTAAFVLAIALLTASANSANAAASAVGLGTASSFAVLGSSTVTNTGPSTISGDIGLSPGTAVTGFPPGVQTSGATYAADALSLQARTNASGAFTSASGQPLTAPLVPVELGGTTLTPDIYETGGVLQITGDLTLDGQGDSSRVFIFRSTATLVTASASRVLLTNSANACNVFWILPSSATLGTGSSMVGTIIASDSIAAQTGTNVVGRLLALNGAVTLDTTSVTSTGCAAVATPPGAPGPGAPGGGGGLPQTGVATAWFLLSSGLAALAVGIGLLVIRRRTALSE